MSAPASPDLADRSRPAPRRWPVAAGAAAVLAVPPLASAALYRPIASGHTIWACPLLESTGVPCPACGATRAFVHFFHGDGAFATYNWAWLALWLAAAVISALALWRLLRGRPAAGPRLARAGSWLAARPWRPIALSVGFVLVAWVVAMANLPTIEAG